MPENPNPNLIQGMESLAGWEAVDSKPIIPGAAPTGAPPQPTPHDMPAFFQGSIPPQIQHDASFVGTKTGSPRIPQYALMPLGIQGNPATNAAITSTTRIIAPTVSKGGSGLTSVGLSMPGQFSVTNSPLIANGTIGVSWTAEPNGTFLGVASSPTLTYPDFQFSTGSATASVSSSMTVPGANDVVFYFAQAAILSNNDLSSPTGGTWTQAFSNSNNGGMWYQTFAKGAVISETALYTPSAGASGNGAVSNAYVSFPITGTPVVTNLVGATGSVGDGTSTAAATIVSGTVLLSVLLGSSEEAIATQLGVVDTKGNVWHKLTENNTYNTFILGQGFVSSFISVWACFNPAPGSTTFTMKFSSPTQSDHLAGNGDWRILSVTNLAPTNNIPLFRFVEMSDLSGILPLAKGGTGSNLGTTGGASQFLRQNSAGANITVVQPDYSDLAGANPATKYNNVNLVFPGLVSLVASATNTGQSAAIGPTAIASGLGGLMRITWVAKVTTAATTSSTLGGTNGFQLSYTDLQDGVVVTTPVWWGGGNNGAAPTEASGNTTQTYITGSLVVYRNASSALRYQFDYTSSGATAMQYYLFVKVEIIG